MATLDEMLARANAHNAKHGNKTPIADRAFALINDKTKPLIERLPEIFTLAEQAANSDVNEQETAAWIGESLYASATEVEFLIIKQYEESLD